MALKILPLDIQSKFSASTQINTFKTAVEELLYNAFDADSTSIAIRIDVQENFIQVVDNGHGVAKNDFILLGQRHSTSKYQDGGFKSNQKYGCSGQALANIIEVSESVKITSRCKNRDEAWVKHFYKGKEQCGLVRTTRPCIGTTIEVKGFLYNMTIQKKAIKALQEMQRLKTFLIQMSLVHCNTSISLRDNTANEIIFKIHKNRDMRQTLISLMDIDKSNFQELQVEKNQYKVTGYIQKPGTESFGWQWIYVNNRIINNSNLHKIVNQNLIKSAPSKKILKVKSYNNDQDEIVTKNKLPDYFIFITCPWNDYDIISNPKHSMLECKNRNQIDKLLEKLVNFFNGTNLKKKGLSPKVIIKNNKADEKNTRNQVKQIMNKILGSHHAKNKASQLHNGVKGKASKRKIKRNTKEKSTKTNTMNGIKSSIQAKKRDFADVIKHHDEPFKDGCNTANTVSFKIPKKKPLLNDVSANANKQQKKSLSITKVKKTKQDIVKRDPVISKFEKESDEVRKRCGMLAKKVKHFLDYKKKRQCKVFTNEIVQYSTVVTDNKSVSVRKKIDEVIIHEYFPLPPRKPKVHKRENDHKEIMKSYDLIHPVTNVVNIQTRDFKTRQLHPKEKSLPFLYDKKLQDIVDCDLNIPRLTYESHSYSKHSQSHQNKEKFEMNKENYENNCFQFAIESAREKLASSKKRKMGTINTNWKNCNKRVKLQTKTIKKHKTDNFVFTDVSQSSYSIHFTETESQPNFDTMQSIMPNIPIASNMDGTAPLNDETHIGTTYTIIDSDKVPNNVDVNMRESKRNIQDLDVTCDISVPDASIYLQDASSQSIGQRNPLNSKKNSLTMDNNNVNVVFVSNSLQSPKSNRRTELNTDESIDPLRICETILQEHSSGEYTFIFDSINNVIELNASSNPCKTVSDLNQGSNNGNHNHSKRHAQGIDNWTKSDDVNMFAIKNRRRFIPKGMSPIFENCNSKNVCDYKFEKDYFEDTMYNNFAQDVQYNTEIFEPTIQNVKELASKDIERVNIKLKKQNACLTFNGETIKEAQVLGQVDRKFIATKINDKMNGKYDYLVLFDQHAVHERIRLETNMAEYYNGNQWKSISLDGISLHLSKDEIVYLHNCKDKFLRLGLEWHIVDDTEISVTAIPEAILGRNDRQVDMVLKAVKNLIKEVINMIKEQGGCVSLYPKAIMDLVFSEACRYAIMFGEVLSKGECESLLNALSGCKTPFQCAHGRPVMAVLTDIKPEKRAYKVNFGKVQRFGRLQNLSN